MPDLQPGDEPGTTTCASGAEQLRVMRRNARTAALTTLAGRTDPATMTADELFAEEGELIAFSIIIRDRLRAVTGELARRRP